MSSIFTKDIAKIKFSDIKTLVDEKIPESSILDYKKEMISNEKLAKLMISFANGIGGIIIIGISEKIDGKNKTGLPEEIIGVNKEDFSTKITNIALSYSQPTIIPLIETVEIPDVSDKIILLIKISESFRPIMFFSKNHNWSNKWFIRINDRISTADYNIMNKLFNKEYYVRKKSIQNLYDIIKEKFALIKIERVTFNEQGRTNDFIFGLKNSKNNPVLDDPKLKQFQTEFNILLKIFKGDLMYFGGILKPKTSLCLGKYTFYDKRIRCPSHFNLSQDYLIDTMLDDIKKFCEKNFSIILT